MKFINYILLLIMKYCLSFFAIIVFCNTGFAQSVGGTINPASTTVCSGVNTGTLTLTGHVGTVQYWESSSDGGTIWTNIPNTTATQTYTNLVLPSPPNAILYRASVQNGPLPAAYSSTTTITIDPPPVAGTLTGSTTVCTGANSGTLTLTGKTGYVVKWTYSTDGGSTWTNIANTTTTQNYLNLSGTTIYHVFVKNGTCAQQDSASATVAVDPISVGGTVTGADTVCSGVNTGTVTLSGQTGSVVKWESSTDGGNTWAIISSTSATLTYSNLTATTIYHAIVKSGACSSATSSPVTITVLASPNGGVLSGIATVCATSNNGSLTLNGQTGNIIQWESSTDGGNTWNPVSGTNSTMSYLNLSATTVYHVVLQLGGCTAYSSAATITVSPPTVGGSVSASTTVCSGSNTGTLTLTSQTGNVSGWESSVNGTIWNPYNNNDTNKISYLNLTATTYYRAIVQSGACPQASSSQAIITVDPKSVGGIVSGSKTVCTGSNSGSVTLNGQTGNVVKWESSADAGVSWTSITNTTTTQNYLNLTSTTWYRAVVQSGVCSTDTSALAIMTIAPLPVADAGMDTSISLGYSIALTGSGGVNYSWMPATGLTNSSVQNPVASPTTTTTYTLTVTDANGCTGKNDVKVTVLTDYKFLITNLITPNGDGKNDVWYIGNIEEYPLCEVSIFNIYNAKIFSATPYRNDWDGTFNGKDLPDGTYYYVLKCPDSKDESKGYITILRNK